MCCFFFLESELNIRQVIASKERESPLKVNKGHRDTHMYVRVRMVVDGERAREEELTEETPNHKNRYMLNVIEPNESKNMNRKGK